MVAFALDHPMLSAVIVVIGLFELPMLALIHWCLPSADSDPTDGGGEARDLLSSL